MVLSHLRENVCREDNEFICVRRQWIHFREILRDTQVALAAVCVFLWRSAERSGLELRLRNYQYIGSGKIMKLGRLLRES